ncbi:DNA cytosine methyltransferase [Nitrospira sp. MA-1]|nr:DNA cytosine methyltransferase [Nitrospira sp. MA-1]
MSQKPFSSKPTYLSLFAGCGGFDLGFHKAGFTCLNAFDINLSAVETYNQNIPSSKATIADLNNWKNLNLKKRGADVVVAGPPCQGFSTIGKRLLDDPRNNLLLVPVETAIYVGAKVLIIENVPGVLADPHSKFWFLAQARLASKGFQSRTIFLDAGLTGLPQTRKRILLVAHKGKDPIPEWPTDLGNPRSPLETILSLKSSLPNHSPKLLIPGSKEARIAKYINPGQKLCNVRAGDSSVHTWDIAEVFGKVTRNEKMFLETLMVIRRRDRKRDWGDADPISSKILRKAMGNNWNKLAESLINKGYVRKLRGNLYDLSHTFNGKYRRLLPNKPTNCVLTRFCQSTYFLHPYEERGFTIREAARLQGFPDNFIFSGSEKSQMEQVGNAVPPPMAYMVAKWVKRNLL